MKTEEIYEYLQFTEMILMNFPASLSQHHTPRFTGECITQPVRAYYHVINDAASPYNTPMYPNMLPRHSHSFYELNIITTGSGCHYIADNIIPVERGDFFLIAPAISHGYYSEEKLSVFHLLLSDRFLFENSELLRRRGGYYLLFNIEPALRTRLNKPLFARPGEDFLAYITVLADRLCAVDGDAQQSEIATQAALLLICELAAQISSDSGVMSRSLDKTDCKVAAIMEYAAAHYDEKVNFHDLCARFSLSYSAFQKHFYDLSGATPSEFLTDRRLEHAETMLLLTDKPIVEIALECGFYDSPHLINTFLRRRGTTPAKLRKNVT